MKLLGAQLDIIHVECDLIPLISTKTDHKAKTLWSVLLLKKSEGSLFNKLCPGIYINLFLQLIVDCCRIAVNINPLRKTGKKSTTMVLQERINFKL